MPHYDVVVIGAGHNGLTAALYLAQAGYRTLVLERNDRVGGAIRSRDDLTQPGFVHDVYSTNVNLFRRSEVFAEFEHDLARHGLRFRFSDKPFANVYPDGRFLRIYQGTARTEAELRRHHPGDAAGWQALYRLYRTFRTYLLPLYYRPMPSAGAVWDLARALGGAGYAELLAIGRLFLSTARELGDRYFATEEARALIPSWGMHLDFGPDTPGSFIPFVEAFNTLEEGVAVVESGASRLPEALAALIREHGGTIRTGCPVARLHTVGDRVDGVETADGELITADLVVANLVPTVLFGELLAEADLPDGLRQQAQGYVHGPGTMMIHLALDGPIPWAGGADLDQFAYIHIGPYQQELAQTYTDALNGLLPREPLLVVGQTTAVDPTRTPGDEHLVWLQVRTLPGRIRGDAAGEIDATDWDAAKEAIADRAVAKLAQYAPGLPDRILGRYVLSPLDLERNNPNLVGGDSIGGSHHLSQHFLWRPFAGASRYRMPLANLYMVGAGTWPGGGNNATSGYLAAQQILRRGAADGHRPGPLAKLAGAIGLPPGR